MVFLGGIAAHLLTIGIARFAYTPLLPVMQAAAGLSRETAGILGALIYAGYLSAVVSLSGLRSPAARLAVFRVCIVLALLSTAMMPLSDWPWVWALSRYLGGFSGAGGMLLAAEFILGWLRRNGAIPDLGPHFMGLGLGICLSGLVALVTGEHLGWVGQWGVFSVLALILLPVAWRLVPDPMPVAPAGDSACPSSGILGQIWARSKRRSGTFCWFDYAADLR